MMDFLEMFGAPLVACILMGAVLSHLGMHVLKREVIFIDIAVAQVAAVGTLAAHMIFDVEEESFVSYLCSLACVLAMAGFYAVIRWKVRNISIEAVIGISYAIAAAGAMFLVGIQPGHAHAHEILAGGLLWVTWPDVGIAAAVFVLVGIALYAFRKPLSVACGNHSSTARHDLRVMVWDFVFYALLGVVITIAVRLSGVVTVFAMLIIPATASAFFASTEFARLLLAWITVVIASLGGMLLSYHYDFCAGPAIAVCLGVLLTAAAIFIRIPQRPDKRRNCLSTRPPMANDL
jgi:zinc/manganese transport system permease protein